MEFLNAINLEQLGTAGGFIAFVIWLYASEKRERIKWQDTAFRIAEDSQKEIHETTRVFEQVLQALKNG